MLCLALLTPVLLSSAAQSGWPLTRAELSDFKETSHYSDVVAFLEGLQAKGAPIQVKNMGKSTDGYDMLLVIASRPGIRTPEEARRSGKPVIYIQANIHAGEVEGKEAAQHLLRKWSQEQKGVLDKCVVLMTPIYNIDGNEKFGPVARNRPGQNGPDEVGLRPNGQGFDLNRDCIKAESPEMRAILKYVYAGWDPDVVMDLHTTDGTRHGYQLTYSPPLNPNTDPEVMKYTRDQLLPSVRRELRTKFNLETFDYGNAERRGDALQWFTFGQEGRYVTNYAGLRNRIGVLSESVVYETFRDRVRDTERFVQSVVDYVLRDPKRVVEMTRRADERTIGMAGSGSLGVRFDFADRGSEDVRMERPAPAGAPRPSGPIRDVATQRMVVNDRFKSTRIARMPRAYLLPASERGVVDLLIMHGVIVEELNEGWSTQAESFTPSVVDEAQNAFQGHKLVRLEGTFSTSGVTAPAHSYLVRCDQALGGLAFHLLEPESLDGVAAWGFLSEKGEVGKPYPIQKVYETVNAKTRRLP
jgi:hypothetical protein